MSAFISGENIQERMRRDLTIEPLEARRLITRVLEGLDYLHSLSDPISHNEVTNQNVMLDLSGKEAATVLIDFGQARRKSEGAWHPKTGHDPYYLAPECLNGESGPASDVFAAGALYYHMLFGIPPWYLNISQYQAQHSNIHAALDKERRTKLKYPNLQSGLSVDERDLKALERALSLSPSMRFATAGEFLEALAQKSRTTPARAGGQPADNLPAPSKRPARIKRGLRRSGGHGGTEGTPLRDVVKALKERRLPKPMGSPSRTAMLFYGPPGCGQTVIGEKLAEEVGLNYRLNRAIRYSQHLRAWHPREDRRTLQEAREKAPTILLFDELDAMLPNRDNDLGHSYAAEVNEFLTQMGNCSKDGVFMIGATNRPDLIDPAVLRRGRMDKLIYIPPPDMEARRAMFQMHLEGRPVADDIDYVALAAETNKRVASDIEFFVNEAAREAYVAKLPINQEHLLKAIKVHKRLSVSDQDLDRYSEMRKRLESGEADPQRKPVGFQAATKAKDDGKD
ncbi:MAG: AAA family ATPase [Flavobacteriales bacterium]|nr:AAA family ATPase [Flavobacteriales bacterium]